MVLVHYSTTYEVYYWILNVNFHLAEFPEYLPRFSMTSTVKLFEVVWVTEEALIETVAVPSSGILSCSSA